MIAVRAFNQLVEFAGDLSNRGWGGYCCAELAALTVASSPPHRAYPQGMARLSWRGWLVITHFADNRAQCRVTSLIATSITQP